MVAGQGAQVTVIVQGENVRDKELAYLDGLLARYEFWRDHYTPLAGIAEVRAAVKDGPRLDLPMPFIPPEFEKLVEHGYDERAEVKRVRVDDLREAVAEQWIGGEALSWEKLEYQKGAVGEGSLYYLPPKFALIPCGF